MCADTRESIRTEDQFGRGVIFPISLRFHVTVLVKIRVIEKRGNSTPSREAYVVAPTKRQFARSASCACGRRREQRNLRADGQGHEVLAPRVLISRTRALRDRKPHTHVRMAYNLHICTRHGLFLAHSSAQSTERIIVRLYRGIYVTFRKIIIGRMK